jgi:hypothetical protein
MEAELTKTAPRKWGLAVFDAGATGGGAQLGVLEGHGPPADLTAPKKWGLL